MSVTTAVSFHLSPSDVGYTLVMDFPCLESQIEVEFSATEFPKLGTTVDLYSQNGKVGGAHPLSFFTHKDVHHIKNAVKLPLPKQEDESQTLFVLDLTDQDGKYGDVESIRQS